MKAFFPTIREPTDAEGLREDLTTNVCAAVRVISADQVENHRNKFMAVMRQVRPDSEGECAATPHGANGCGFVAAYGHSQHPHVWEVRLAPKMRTALSGVYGTPETSMAVSCDNVFYWGEDSGREAPPKFIDDKDAFKAVKSLLGSSLRLHIDVAKNDSHGANVQRELSKYAFPYSLQAQVNLYDVTATSAGLVLVDGDMEFGDDSGYFENRNSDYCQVTSAGYEAFREKLVKPCVPAGCALIWRSDRVHANCKAQYGEDPKRLGVFVTWHPRLFEYDRKRKFECIQEGMVGTHWPLQVPDKRSLNRWKRAGSHMSNGGQLSKKVVCEFSAELSNRIMEAI